MNRELNFFGKILRAIGALNENHQMRVLHPAMWISIPIMIILNSIICAYNDLKQQYKKNNFILW